MRCLEPLDHRLDPSTLRADAPARLCDEATGHLRDANERRLDGAAVAETGARTDDVERRAAGAGELVGRRAEVARVDPRDCGGQLCLELSSLLGGEHRRDDRIGPLEE